MVTFSPNRNLRGFCLITVVLQCITTGIGKGYLMYFQMMHNMYIFICCIILWYIHNLFIHIELFQKFLLPSSQSGSRTCPGAGCYGAVYRGEMKVTAPGGHKSTTTNPQVELGPGVTRNATHHLSNWYGLHRVLNVIPSLIHLDSIVITVSVGNTCKENGL